MALSSVEIITSTTPETNGSSTSTAKERMKTTILSTTKKSINNNNNQNNIISGSNSSSNSISTGSINNNKSKINTQTLTNSPRTILTLPEIIPEFDDNLPVEELLKLDRYASIFIPEWLISFNRYRPYQIVEPRQSEISFINYERLKDGLFPKILQALARDSIRDNRARISKTLIVIPPLPRGPAPISHRIVPQKPDKGGAIPIVLPNGTRAPPPPGFKNVDIDDSVLQPTAATTFVGGKRKRVIKLQELSGNNYAQRFLPILHLELEARTLLLDQANLYAVTITPVLADYLPPPNSIYDPYNPHNPNSKLSPPILLSLAAKSIREGEPPVDLGDLVQLRQIRLDTRSWQGVLWEASVYSINRASGKIVLRCDSLIGTARESMVFNICWKPQTNTFKAWGAAIESCHLALNPAPPPSSRLPPHFTSTPELKKPDAAHVKKVRMEEEMKRIKEEEERENRVKNQARCWFFPEEGDAILVGREEKMIYERDLILGSGSSTPINPNLKLNGGISSEMSRNGGSGSGTDQCRSRNATIGIGSNQGWVDTFLNEEQKYACQSIVWGKHKIPFLISGPPGTGKTKTLVESILQILKKHPHTSVLVCGASNPSADTLAMRLRHHLGPKEMFRLIAPSRNFGEVPQELLPFCFVENERFSIPSFEVLLSKRVIVTTCLDASILLEAGCTNRALSGLQAFTLSTISPSIPLVIGEPHFGYLLIDEAAQALEADVACAISVVLTEDHLSKRSHLTICGDQFQLGPEINSEEAREFELDVSLLGRLAERKVYKEHECRRGGATGKETGKLGIPFVNLTKNYRSCTEILMMPSTLFYNETLEPFAPASTQESPLRDWTLLPNPGFPILFRGVEGIDEPIDEGASFFNELEIQMVCDLVQNLVSGMTHNGKVKPSEISVISPFRQQVWLIRLKLRGMKLGDVDVGNVEALQGAENRVVIISTVRSQPKFLPFDKARSKGLIHEPRRFNVAMTRAKELLIVVGNPEVLNLDPWWKAFTRFCIRNHCYQGPEIEDSESHLGGVQYISRLESEHRNKNKKKTLSVRKGDASIVEGEEDGITDGLNVQEKSEDEEENERMTDADFDYLVGSLVRQTLQE